MNDSVLSLIGEAYTQATMLQKIGALLFFLAVVHTFLVSKFEHLAHKYPEGSVGENLFHFLSVPWI